MIVVSVRETWLNASLEMQDVLVAFAGWMAKGESAQRSERIRADLERRRSQGLPVGRQPGATTASPARAPGMSPPGRTASAGPPTAGARPAVGCFFNHSQRTSSRIK